MDSMDYNGDERYIIHIKLIYELVAEILMAFR